MRTCDVVFYREADGSVPVLDWLARLAVQNRKALLKAHARLALLEQSGHELRRPIADTIGEGLLEMRWRVANVNYRILFFFHGRHAAVLAHGLTKEAKLPAVDIERALARKRRFEADPQVHSYVLEVPDA